MLTLRKEVVVVMDAKHEPHGVTTALATWASEAHARRRARPKSSRHLKTCLLDSIGCGLFGAAAAMGRASYPMSRSTSAAAAPSSLFARRERVSPADAALANGTAIHGFELDDAHVASSLHPGAVALPASLATAEVEGASGEQFLTALVVGYEVGLRLGVCAGVAHSTSGYHVTGTVGAVGAAAAAARAPVAFAGAVCARARDRRDAGRGSLRGETWRDDQTLSRRQGRAERGAECLPRAARLHRRS